MVAEKMLENNRERSNIGTLVFHCIDSEPPINTSVGIIKLRF